jgi:hypothetical protein
MIMLRERSEARILCADLVDIRWQDKTGRGRKATAILEDISSSGACIQLDGPVPLNTEIKILYPKGHLLGTVRYCNYRDIGYFVGLEFVEDSKWSKKQYEPQHMLDMTRLISRSLRRAGRRPSKTVQ